MIYAYTRTDRRDPDGEPRGHAIIDGAGIFAQYLEFYEWDKYYDDIVWIRTKVIER